MSIEQIPSIKHDPGSRGLPRRRATVSSSRPAPRVRITQEYSVVAPVVHRLDAALTGDIDALAGTAVEPNVFHESWMLDAALEHLDVPELILVQVYHGSTLVGLFPLHMCRRFRNLPLRNLRSWSHEYMPLGSPLIAAGHVSASLAALLDWIGSKHAPALILDLASVRADGPIATALSRDLHQRQRFAVHRALRERALLDLRQPVTSGISGKHRKEIRRQQRRLAELGSVEYRALKKDEPVAPWIERFLAIEMSGWKGAEGTAMGVEAGDRAFLAQIAQQAHRRGQLQMLELTLDGATIATKCNLISGEAAFMFKIGYDQNYAKYSPGLLLELFNMDYLRSPACSALAWADSCAKSQHFMIDRLWTGRRVIGYYAVCGQGLIPRNVVRHGPRMQRIWQRLNASAKVP